MGQAQAGRGHGEERVGAGIDLGGERIVLARSVTGLRPPGMVRTSKYPNEEKFVQRPLFLLAFAFIGASFLFPAVERAAAAEAAKPAMPQSGKALEVLNANNYTYVRVDTGKEKLWIAGPASAVKVGDRIAFPKGIPMTGFQSKALGRSFDLVYFVDAIEREGAEPAKGGIPPGHPPTAPNAGGADAAKFDYSKITKPAGGKTVAEIIQDKKQLAGKKVAVRGKVVKFSPEIMGKNWIHLNDGTVKEGGEDLTITTKAKAKVGDTVLVRGVVVTEKDFGFGYQYAVIIEDAAVTVE